MKRPLPAAAALVLAAISSFAAPAPEAVPWLEFPVEPQKVYTVSCVLAPESVGGEAVLRFYDADGRDIAATERSLGFAESVARKEFPSCASSFALACRAGSGTGMRPVRGVVRCEKGGPAKVLSCRASEGAPEERDDGAAGFDRALEGEGDFTPNLAPNGSFEELAADGNPKGWRWTGPGRSELTSQSYAGRRALKLSAASEGGRWETEPIALEGTNAVQIFYAVKFSRHATPCGHLDPVRVVFLRKDAKGQWQKVPEPSLVPRMEFSYAAYGGFYGDWFPVLTRRHAVPSGATALRIFCEHRDRRVDGHGGSAAWGDIFVDNVAVYQAKPATVPVEFAGFAYARIFFGGGQLPPQLPVGRRRENSVAFAQGIHADGSMFFADERADVSVDVLVGDLAGYRRELTVNGEVVDVDGKRVSSFSQRVDLNPFASSRIGLRPGVPPKFGAYEVRCAFVERGTRVGSGTARFAWAAGRSRCPRAERDRADYPFDLHLGAGLNYNWQSTPEIADLQAHLCDMLGVRGVRVQVCLDSFRPDQTPAAAAEAARKLTAAFRVYKEPALRRHGLRWWPSLMEQGHSSLPRTPQTETEFAAWRAWHRAFAESLGGEADFVLYGNEGLGGYTAHLKADDSLKDLSGFDGTTRHWWRCCRVALEGLKEGDANLPCGLAHASDETGAIARLFRTSPEGNFPIDCWGVNSYVNPEVITSAIVRELGTNLVARTFGVIPEIGHGAYKPEDFVLCARRLPEIYLSVKADAPWVRHVAWFILGEFNAYGMFDNSFAPRPAAVSYLTMAATLGAGAVETSLRLRDEGRFFIWRKADGTAVGAGWSPTKLPVCLKAKGADVSLRDLYGNPRKLAVEDAEALVRLGPEMTYVVGADDLALVKPLAVEARVDGDGQTVELAVRNERRVESRLTLETSAHPLVRLGAPPRKIRLAPGERRTFRCPFAARRTNDGRGQVVTFSLSDERGMTDEASVDVSARATLPTPCNLLANPAMDAWRADGTPENWSVSLQPGPGGKKPAAWSVRRCGDDGFLAAPSLSIWVKGIAPMYFARIECRQTVPLKANTRYYFSVAKRLAASGNWPFPLVSLRGGRTNPGSETVLTKPAVLPESPARSRGWMRCETVFETGDRGPFEAGCILRMQNIGYGEVRYDDAELFELGPRTDGRSALDAEVSPEACDALAE